MKIFVPGRLYLFGEHSDWGGGYRRHNPVRSLTVNLLQNAKITVVQASCNHSLSKLKAQQLIHPIELIAPILCEL